ncbi:hypothetical protein [Paractinoplanes maris]|uniref:hypothetical protein n=1 Tax=Paractinoplanes maris TaxID=1734446 RepID=UPI00202202F0|nr:hypothetical protein [Actinoplanes maris]
MQPADTVLERITGVLSCLALDSRLGGVLFIDLRPDLLQRLATWLNDSLAGPDGSHDIVTLGAADTDEDLWWRVSPQNVTPMGFRPTPGPLIDAPGAPPKTIIVPDLARAGLAVTRAATVLIGSWVGVADRHGMHAEWAPGSRWLSACARSDLPRLSPHLLDRFPMRVDARDLSRQPFDPKAVRKCLETAGDEPLMPVLPAPMPVRRWSSQRRPPTLSPEAIDLVTDLIGATTAPHRRDLALARTARAIAAWEVADVVDEDHVRAAARLMGLPVGAADDNAVPTPLPTPQPASAVAEEVVIPQSSNATSASSTATSATAEARSERPEVKPSTVPVAERKPTGAGPSVRLAATALPPGRAALIEPEKTLYPENDDTSIAEYASLRRPWQRVGSPSQRRGTIIGAEPTRQLADIAVVPTMLEAAKFQSVRHHLTIRPSDLRRHRRQPLPDTALVLMIDHSCRRDWNFTAALSPYLRWAYTQRSAVSLIELGHRETEAELRAIRRRLGGTLDPGLDTALGRHPGRATPLAAGLDLAIQEMRLYLRNLPIRPEGSWLVVVSDGRGNIPLEASQRNLRPTAVNRAGIDDAVTVAADAARLPAVRVVILAPPSLAHYRDLPFALADAMGGIVARTEPSHDG